MTARPSGASPESWPRSRSTCPWALQAEVLCAAESERESAFAVVRRDRKCFELPRLECVDGTSPSPSFVCRGEVSGSESSWSAWSLLLKYPEVSSQVS